MAPFSNAWQGLGFGEGVQKYLKWNMPSVEMIILLGKEGESSKVSLDTQTPYLPQGTGWNLEILPCRGKK